jgi:MoaA/NifB/PqqE/SkfB family radical SAM enzyme
MDVAKFSRVVAHLPPGELGVLHGIGEPTLHPHFLELIRIAKSSGRFARLHCNTNALANDVEFYFEMVEQGLDSFSVSVDSLTPDIAAVTRSGTEVSKLLTRLKMFHRLGLPFVVQMVVSQLNYNDIFFTLRALNDIGEFTVYIQPFIDYDNSGHALPRTMAALFLNRLNGWSSLFDNVSVHTSGFRNLGITAEEAGTWLCTAPWLDPGIDVEGYLTPCCVHLRADTLGRCNLAEMSLADAWRQEPVRRFMSAYVKRPPHFCTTCSENVRRDTAQGSFGSGEVTR